MQEPTRLPRKDDAAGVALAFIRSANLAQRPSAEPRAIFDAAAKGDHDAQAALVHAILADALDGLCDPLIAVGLAEAFARMAAVSERPDDLARLAAIVILRLEVLTAQGNYEAAVVCEGLALSIFDRAAAAGDSRSEEMLQAMSDAVTPEGAAMAVRFQALQEQR